MEDMIRTLRDRAAEVWRRLSGRGERVMVEVLIRRNGRLVCVPLPVETVNRLIRPRTRSR